jgi:hypothetical protein
VLSILDEEYIEWLAAGGWRVRTTELTNRLRSLIRAELNWFRDAPERQREHQRLRNVIAYHERNSVCPDDRPMAACSFYVAARGGSYPLQAPEVPTCNRDGSPIRFGQPTNAGGVLE